MECPTCKTDLPDGSKFCSQCGTAQSLACQACGHGNAASCQILCGLAAPIPDVRCADGCGRDRTSSFISSTVAPLSERRQLSVMFCDLVGSVSLAERLDPEDFNAVLATYLRQATTIVEAGGGLVARYLGDGILAYFGYPVAHEDDTEQAITTGLELIKAVGELGPAPDRLRVRIGIATGTVIVGDLIHSGQMDQPSVVGETPNLAARLQALAQPNTVVIDERTRRLIRASVRV